MSQSLRRGKALVCAAAMTLGVLAPAASTVRASEVAAQVGDKKITLEEVDKKGMELNSQAYQGLYDARRTALEQLVERQLLETEAKKRGMSTDDLFKVEVSDKLSEITDADVEAWFNQNKSRVGNRTLDQIKEQIRGFLVQQQATQIQQEFFASLKSKTKITMQLEPPRVEVVIAATDPTMGPAGAPITIVEYSDFQ